MPKMMPRPLGTRPVRGRACPIYTDMWCRASGHCTRVDDNAASASTPPVPPHKDPGNAPCKYFLRQKCTRGERCGYYHPPDCEAAAKEAPTVDTRAGESCTFFAKGHCRNGDSCPFKHDADAAQNATEEEEDTFISETEEKCTRELLGASVHFGPGGSVEKVSFLSDFSTIRVTNLSATSGPADVLRILNDIHGSMNRFQIPETCVRMRSQDHDGLKTADIRVEDPDFAKFVVTEYQLTKDVWADSLSGLRIYALELPASKNSDGFTHRTNCKKVVCSWSKPLQVVTLHYCSQYAAKDAQDRFSDGTYKVQDKRVSSELRPPGEFYCDGEDSFRCSGSILVLRVPLNVQWEHIVSPIPGLRRPRQVLYGGTTYDTGSKEQARQLGMIEDLLATFGPLESRLVANTETPGTKVKAMARFADEDHAKEAVERLNDSRLPFDEYDKLSIKLVYSATFKVATRIFEAVREAIEAVDTAQKGQPISFKTFPPTKGQITLRLETESQKELSAAEKVVDGIFRGQTVTENDSLGRETPFWNSCFGSRTAGSQNLQAAILEPIEEEFRVVFQCRPAKAEIRVYGMPGKTEKACNALRDVFTSKNFIRLDDESFQWVVRGGLKDLKDALGPKNVILSIWPTLKRIEIIGPHQSCDLARDLISEKKETWHSRQEATACSVCWTEDVTSLTTRCGHTYCLDCFENFCKSADFGDGSSLRCLADSGACGAEFSLAELQKYLPSLAFETLLVSSAKSYINRRPNEFQYCPTPGCERIYRPTAPECPRAFTCADCQGTACTSCRLPHTGMTCPESRYILSGGEKQFAKAKKKFGIKDCPKCNVPIQKRDGCNHMVCTQCKTHLCWACLRSFANERLYNLHQGDAHHGNNYGDASDDSDDSDDGSDDDMFYDMY